MARITVIMGLLAALAAGCDEEGSGPGVVVIDGSTADAAADAGAGDGAPTDAAPTDAAPSDAAPSDAATDAAPSDGGADAAPFSACLEGARPADGRTLGIDLLDVPPGTDFDTNLGHADALGVSFISLHLTWPMLETDGMPSDGDDILATFAAVLEAYDLKLSLTVRPIDLTGKTVPADLSETRFSDPQMAARFNAVVDHILGIIPAARLTSLQIGNEIDGFDASGEHPDFWSDYGQFLATVVAHVHAAHPGLEVGFTGTLHGLLDGQLAGLGVFSTYAGLVDVVGVTYYPLDGGFGTHPPAIAGADLDRLVAAFPETPLRLQEVGYPSGVDNASDEARQAAFFCAFFRAWDAHADRITSANIVRLYDVSEEGARTLAGPYGLETPAFVEFLRTLGLRTHAGPAKQAFDAIRAATGARGF